MENTNFEHLLEVLKAKGEALGDAMAHESELEDDRAAIKADAIKRVMKRDNLAVTPAEKIVETDEEYFKHRARQRASIVARFRADAEYQAAKAQATRASLITPSMVELTAKIAELSRDLGLSKRETDLREIALRRANGYLADRIRDVEQLTASLTEKNDTLARLGEDIAELKRQLETADRTIERLEMREETGGSVLEPLV